MEKSGKPIKIGLCGLGTVGSGTFNVLSRNLTALSDRIGCPLEISLVGARRDNPLCDLTGVSVTRDIFDVPKNPDVDIVVELIGGTTIAKDIVMEAIAQGKHVVTANKALIAEFGDEIFAAAQDKNVSVYYEAAVAGGIPIIKALREGLSANNVEWLAGIINGTGNFILTEMGDKDRDFADVLKEAQEKGYAEADPTFDVEGIDAAHKLVILASLAFAMPLAYDKVFTEGISQIETCDIQNAEKMGYRIKHLGIAKRTPDGIELRVHPTLIPAKRLIANVNGVMNAVVVKGDAVGPTLYYGAGAGAEPTASAVVADIVDIARQLNHGAANQMPALGFHSVAEQKLLTIGEVETAFYLRLTVEDKPGVLSRITTALSDSGISIEAMHQNEPEASGGLVDVLCITDTVKEKLLNNALESIKTMDFVEGDITIIRVETLG